MTAIISDCGKYRYLLERECAGTGPVIGFIGVNPSTADAQTDDATVRKWRGFATRWGASVFIVANVFAYRATDVRELARCEDPIGPVNRHYMFRLAERCSVLVPCWGSREKLPANLRKHMGYAMDHLVCSGRPVKVLGLTKSGDPMHPLMLGYNTPLTDWVQP